MNTREKEKQELVKKIGNLNLKLFKLNREIIDEENEKLVGKYFRQYFDTSKAYYLYTKISSIINGDLTGSFFKVYLYDREVSFSCGEVYLQNFIEFENADEITEKIFNNVYQSQLLKLGIIKG
jgi:hypothetical protein